MAKTTSQIIAENKIKRAEAAAIAASRDKIHQQQMAGVAEESSAKTLAVLNKAISGTTDSTKKSELSRAAQMVKEEYTKYSSQQKSGAKTATDMQKKKENRIEEKHQADSLRIKKDQAQKALDDFDNNKEIDWTDTNQRKAYDAERKRLQDEVDRAGAEIDKRENARIRENDMAEIESWSDEDREQLRRYISSDSNTGNILVNSNPILWFKENKALGDSAKYLYGKYGEEKTKQLASSYSRYLNEEEAKKIEEDTKNAVNKSTMSAIGQNILGIGTRLFGGLQATVDRFGEALDRDERYPTLAPFTSGDLMSLHGNTVTAQTAQNITGADGGILRQGAAYLYQGGMTMVDSFARAAAGGGAGGTAALAACNAFSQTVSDASRQGATPEQAYTLGAAVAGVEYLSEKIPMDRVFKLAKGGNTKVLAQAFTQAGIEISTEELSLLGTMAAEAAILQEKSSYKQQIGDLVANGASYEDAKTQADKAVWEEVKQTALVSGFAGSLSGGGAAIVGNLATNNAPAVTEQLLEGIRDMTPAPEPLTEELQHFDNAAAIANGVQPAQQSAADTTLAAETPAEESTVINTDPAQHTPEEQATIDAYQNSIDDNLVAYIEAVRNNPGQKMPRYPLKNVDTRAADDIKRLTGIDTTGNKTQIEARAVEHILKRHGEHGNGDHSMRDVNDIARIQYVIDNYDSMEHGGKTSAYVYQNEKGRNVHAQTVVIKKKVNGTYFVVEAVPDTKKKTLFVVSAYMSQNGQKETAPSLSGDAEAYRVTSDNATKSDAVSNNSIPENVAQVNGNYSFEHLGRANAAIAEFRQSDEYKAMSHDQRVQAINEIIDYFVRVVDENEPGVAVVSDRDQQSTQPNVDLTTAQEETVYHDEFEDWGKDPNREGVANPLSDRSYSEVGKRSVKAYMYENPAVKPFYQEQAAWLLSELADSTKGERTYNEQLHYESGGEQGWSGTKRHTSESIAELLDQDGMSYDQIERGLNAIVNDHGQENNAVSKRIEFVINDRLMNGYTDFYTGQKVPGNAEYLNLLRNQQSVPTADMQMGATNQSAAGGQIKGTGAAEQNFSGKPTYNAILSEENAQPDRQTDVRPMELPKTDVNGGNVSATTANVYGSQNTPDDLAAAMEEPVSRGDYSYVRISNDAATERARQEIGRAGDWDAARLNFARDVETGIAGAEISARGALILNHAAEVYQQAKDSGDMQAAARAKKAWLGVLSDVQKLGTNTAQGMQALKIIRNLAPQDKIQFAQMAVQNMVRDMRLNTDIQIDERLLTEYESATTDQQRDEIIERIQQNVADQIPSTMLDKWNALRYTNMLGNLKTNVRNVFGNAANTAVYRFKDLTGAVLESIANKASGGKVGRTKSVIVNKQLQKAMEPYYQQVKNAIGSGGKYADNASASSDFAQGVMDKRRIFKSNAKNETVRKIGDAVLAPMEGYRKATNWMMNNEYFGDEAFGKAAFTHSLAGYLQANGIRNAADVKNASPDLMDRAIAYAVKEAQETTFHDNSALANVLGRLKKDAGIIGEGLLPFTKTPANVLTRAEEYSPLGILNTAILSAQKVAGNTKLADANGRLGSWAARGQDITGTDIINSLSKTLTGAGIFALGAILKNNGILNGGPDDDEEQAAFDKMNGIQPYSINLPNGTTYTLDWLTPVAMPLFMGAQLMQIAGEKDLTFADLEEVFTSIADPMIQMSMMQGINSSLEDIKYSGNNMGQFFLNAAVNYLTQGLTNTLLGQIERSTEENRQTTFINPDSNTPQWAQKALGKASQKIPGWDYQQMDYVDPWGQKQKNEGGLLYNLLSPGYSSTKKSDNVTAELDRLRESTGESVFPDAASKTVSYIDKDGYGHDDIQLTADQFQKLAETQGQTARKLVEDMVGSAEYAALTDKQKADAIDTAYLYARKTGEIAAVDDHTGYDQSWFYDVEKGGAKEIVRRVLNSGINTAMSDLDTAWDRGYDEETFNRELQTAYDSYKNAPDDMKKQVYAEAEGTAKKYIEARDKGISHEDFAAAAENVAKVKGTGSINKDTGKATIRDIDRRQAIANTSGLSEKEVDIVMKAYMADYDPSDESPETTEMKYDYIQQELDLSAKEYTATYRAYLDNSKKAQRIAAIRALGYDYGTALKLYKVYSGSMKKKLIDMYG